MPTASDFEAAAHLFDRAAESVGEWTVGVGGKFGPDTVSGGRLTVACLEVVIAAGVVAVESATELAIQAAVCRQRATAARVFDAAMADYHNTTLRWRQAMDNFPEGGAMPPRPVMPVRPAYVN